MYCVFFCIQGAYVEFISFDEFSAKRIENNTERKFYAAFAKPMDAQRIADLINSATS